jgi:hypothetical protein
MKISDDRGKISDPASKRDISEISESTGRYFFPWAQVDACLVHLEIVLILTHDRCIVCSKRTIGLEIIFDAPDGTSR